MPEPLNLQKEALRTGHTSNRPPTCVNISFGRLLVEAIEGEEFVVLRLLCQLVHLVGSCLEILLQTAVFIFSKEPSVTDSGDMAPISFG